MNYELISVCAHALCRWQVVDAPPAHLQAEEAEQLPQQGRPYCLRATAAQVYEDKEAEPSGGCPSFLRVPRPIGAPSLFCPQSSEEHSDGDEGQAYPRQVVYGFQVVLPLAELPKREERGNTNGGVGEHIDNDMGREPRTLKGRHQHLVVNLGFQEVYADEDGAEQCAEREHPTIVPTEVSYQANKRQEEGIPQPGLAHRAQRRTLQREPHQGYVSAEDEQAADGQQRDSPPPSSQKRKHSPHSP